MVNYLLSIIFFSIDKCYFTDEFFFVDKILSVI